MRWWTAAAMGALPDVVAFLPARVAELARGDLNVRHEVRPLSDYPPLTLDLYHLSHSMLGTLIVCSRCG